LTQLHKAGQLDRLRSASQFRYLAPDPQLNRRQREQAACGQGPGPTTSLSTQTALWVLVEYIRNPGLSFEQMAARLQEQRKLAVAPERIQRFFQEHGLKKTPAAPS
jgi:hypothetical protein